MSKSMFTLVFLPLFLSAVLAFGPGSEVSTSKNQLILGYDISKINISCSVCHKVENEMYAIALNKTQLNVILNAVLDVTCKNGFFKALPHVEAKCVEYVSGMLLSISDTVAYIKPKLDVCSRVLRCDHSFSLKAFEQHGQSLIFVMLSKLSARDPKLASTLEAIALDTKAGLRTLVETACDAAQKTKITDQTLKARIDQLCNFGKRPECSICRTGNDLLKFYVPRFNKIVDERIPLICNGSAGCLQDVGRVLKIAEDVLQSTLDSDFVCFKLHQCDEPPVFNYCEKLPERAKQFCYGLVIYNLQNDQMLMKEHKLVAATPKQACDYCNSTASEIRSLLNVYSEKIHFGLQSFCLQVPLVRHACLYALGEYFNATLAKVTTLLEPDEFCPRFDLCHAPKNVTGVDHKFFCTACNTVVVFVQTKLRDVLLEADIKQRVTGICKHYTKAEKVCDYVIEEYFVKLYELITGPVLSNQICTKIPDCKSPPPKPFSY